MDHLEGVSPEATHITLIVQEHSHPGWFSLVRAAFKQPARNKKERFFQPHALKNINNRVKTEAKKTGGRGK